MKEVKLTSGAVLKMGHTPFAISKALYQALLEDGRAVKLASGTDVNEMLKDLFCIGFSSKKIEAALNDCLKYCIYNDGRGDLKIDASTFEDDKAREDYSIVCIEVAIQNVGPFMKGLFAGLKTASAMMPGNQA